MATTTKKLSFAKVAASAKDPPPPRAPPARAPPVGTLIPKQSAAKPMSPRNAAAAPNTPKIQTVTAGPIAAEGAKGELSPDPVPGTDKPADGPNSLKVDVPNPNLVVNGSGSTITERSSRTGNSQSPSDNVSQRADSSSELGTKPPSLDGKSITSGTTFALDEKESLRPDDSASMKAAADDDETFSIRGPQQHQSRMGSEVAARFRIQLGDMPMRTITTHRLVEASMEGVLTPQSGTSDKHAAPDAQLPTNGGVSGQESLVDNSFFSQYPDEKLIEAMRDQGDRLFLLRLEKDVVDFVQNSKEPTLDLPPANSFRRLLTHKLADYYHMTHSFESVGAVRIFRTPFCRVPPSLASIVETTANTDTVPPAVLPRKIMRRGEEGETMPSSGSPSKPNSEIGGDKPAVAKEKLTREEREEAYNRARERIFGTNEKAENANQDNDDQVDASRASSVSGKDRSNLGKRGKTGRQRREDSESFDSRSNYIHVYGPAQQQGWLQPQYIPMPTAQYVSQPQYQPTYATALPQPFPPQQQAYQPPVAPSNGYMAQPYPNMPQSQQYVAPPAQQRYQPAPSAPMPVPQFTQQMPSPAQPAWQSPGSSPGSYHSRGPPAPGIPYAFGQLPVNANPNDPKSQHPIPGSYSRPRFNPTTQSFVPSGPPNGIQAASPIQYNAAVQPYGSPQLNPQDAVYNGYQQTAMQPQPQMSYGMNPQAYGMARQSSNNSGMLPMSAYPQPNQYQPGMPASPQVMPLGQLPINGQLPIRNGPPHISAKPPQIPNVPPGQNPTYSHLPTYGNPATLPQKPPT